MMSRSRWRQVGLVLIIIFILLSLTNVLISTVAHPEEEEEEEQSGRMRLELVHRHSPKLSIGGKPKFKTPLQRITELLHSDVNRQRMISNKRHPSLQHQHPRKKAWETKTNSSIEIPMHSGADYGTGEYFVSFKVGTPVQKFTLIADTGSDLTWMNCKYRCGHECHQRRRIGDRRKRRRRRLFNADRSSSFKTVPCLSEMCKIELMDLFSLTLCPTPSTPCAYDYRYSDGSSALGLFASETVTVGLTNGRKTKLDKVLIGCSESFKGQSFQMADGVMGLGYSNYSFAFKAAEMFGGGKFSYCLVDHLSPRNVSNYLSFGPRAHRNTTNSNMRFTTLLLGVISPFYAVNVIGISLDGVMLKIPQEVWDINVAGGTILDTGTSLTFLTVPAYQPVMAALKAPLLIFQKLDLNIGPLEYCFNSTGFDESLIPRLAIHFVGGARFEPPVKSYVIDAAHGVKCLGFVSATWPGTSVIGNIMQQNHLWEFDLVKNYLGFAPSACT